MKHSFTLIGLFVLSVSCQSIFASRVFYYNGTTMGGYLHLFLNNPSAVPQTVDISVTTTGANSFQTTSVQSGHLWMSCAADRKSCQNIPSSRSIAAHGNGTYGILILTTASPVAKTPLNIGVHVKITIAENKGFLLGRVQWQWNYTVAGTGISIVSVDALNGGRAF